MIALVNRTDGEGYHFYMQHSDGTWSHKPGNLNVTNKAIYNNSTGSQLILTDITLTNENIYFYANSGLYQNGNLKFTEKLKYKGLFKILSILSHNKQRGMIDPSLAVLYNQ